MDLAHEFPLDEDLIYLNHAAVGPWPRRTARAIEQFTRENLHSAIRHYPLWVAVESRLRERLARLLGSPSPDLIAIQKNTSEALSTVAFGLPWETGDSVVLPADEFPSNSACWEVLADRGVEVRKVDIDRADDPEAALLQRCDRSTRVLAVSHVGYASGRVLDLERLGRACRSAGTLLCVDAIQSLGARALEVEACRIDCLAGGSHKWLLAPEGIGFLYCRAGLIETIEPLARGWRMGETPFGFETPPWGPASNAHRFEAGTLNTLGMIGLDASLSLLEELGYEAVEAAVRRRAEHLIDRLCEGIDGGRIRGLELATPQDPERRLGIVSLRGPRVDEAFRALKAKRILTAVREGLLRFAPHCHTSMAQLDTAIDCLQDA